MTSRSWSAVPLEALVDPARPITYGIVQPGPETADGVPYVRVVDLRDGSVLAHQLRRTSVAIANAYKRSTLAEGDLVVSIRGHVGRTAMVPKAADGANLTQDTARVAVCARADPRFVRWYLESPAARRWMAQRTKGVAVTGINLGDLRQLPIPHPDLAEQRRIAGILDKADGMRRKRREAIALTEELLRSGFLEIFGDPVMNPKGWKVRPLTDLCESKQYGTAEKANSERVGLPVLRMNNLTYSGDVDLADLKWVALPSTEASKLDLRDGDLLFNRVNSHELVGKTAAWHHGEGFTFAGYLIRLRLHANAATGDYVAGAMNMPSMKRTLKAMAKPSINMANISGSDLARVLLPVPPLPLQRGYVALRRTVDSLRERYRRAECETAALFDSLAYDAFRGELTGTNGMGKPQLGRRDAGGQ